MKAPAVLALTALLVTPARAQTDTPRAEANALLAKAVGEGPVDLLTTRGYLLRYGDKKKELLHVQWSALSALMLHARDLGQFLSLYDKVKAGQPPAADNVDLSALLKLPTAGLWSPPLKSAAQLLSTHLENAALLGDQPPGAAPALFATPWGREFLQRAHADLVVDFRPLTGEFFSDFLASPDSSPDAPKHFLKAIKGAYDKDISKMLDRDLSRAQLSEELSGWIAKYLSDQRRLWLLSQTAPKLQALEKTTSLPKDLADLRQAQARLEALSAALPAVRTALDKDIPSPQARLYADKLHLHSSQGAPFDQGDTIEVSAAYWVETADPRGSALVTEAGFLDNGISGISALSVASHERSSGGPYIFTARLRLDTPGKKRYRLLLGAPGAQPASLETEVEVSARLPDLLKLAAQAESEAAACRMSEAAASLAELDTYLLPLADKAQFKALKETVAARRALVGRQALAYKKLTESLPSRRDHASRSRCEFSPEAAQLALLDLSQLPAGCDRQETAPGQTLASELEALSSATQRHKLSQEAFRRTAGRASQALKACRADQAADLDSSALALLDADPDARCAAVEKDYLQTRSAGLPAAKEQGGVGQLLDKSLDESARRNSARDFAGALAEANALIARIDALNDSACFAAPRRKAADISEVAGLSLAPPDPESIKVRLPLEGMKDSPAERPGPAAKPAAKPKAAAAPTKLPAWAAYDSATPVIPKETQEKLNRHRAERAGEDQGQ